jgi:hypothetical protein
VARNNGAQFSLKSYDRMVRYARDDRKLALTIGKRRDIPRQSFLKLLETATTEVRLRLEARNPEAAREIRDTVAEVAGTMQREARDASRRYKLAARRARHLQREHRLTEADVHAGAHTQQFAKTAAALSMLGPFPIDLVERALLDNGTETILLLAKASGCSWATAKTMLKMHSAGRALAPHDLETAQTTFEGLTRDTARRVIKFYEQRTKRSSEDAPATDASDAETRPSIERGAA